MHLFAPLKLYADADAGEKKPQQKNKPVVKEKYEEAVFHEPHEEFYQRLKAHKMKPVGLSLQGGV